MADRPKSHEALFREIWICIGPHRTRLLAFPVGISIPESDIHTVKKLLRNLLRLSSVFGKAVRLPGYSKVSLIYEKKDGAGNSRRGSNQEHKSSAGRKARARLTSTGALMVRSSLVPRPWPGAGQLLQDPRRDQALSCWSGLKREA